VNTVLVSTDATELLWDAHRLVERGWTQHAEARDSAGREVDPWDLDAVTWSLLGALVAALEQHAPRKARDLPLSSLAAALGELALLIEEDSLAAWNDAPARTCDDVTGVLAAAARAAARRPSDA
jgi:hypothetical protein